MSTSGTSMQRATQRQETSNVRARTRTTQKTEEKNDIVSNPFFAIMHSDQNDEATKVDLIAAELTYTEDAEKNREKIKEFNAYKEYLHGIEERLSKDRIALTDTDAFSSLQSVYGEFNGSLEDFIKKMKPLTDIIDALHSLNKNGSTRDALSEIESDKEIEKTYRDDVNRIQSEISSALDAIERMRRENERHSENKGFFGFGAIKADSLASIKTNERLIQEAVQANIERGEAIESLHGKYKEWLASQTNTFEKEKLRELLDLTSDQHKVRQKEIVDAALHFVEQGAEKFDNIYQSLEKLGDQVESLTDNNHRMALINATLNEATIIAEQQNNKKREIIRNVPENASLTEKLKSEEDLRNINDHIEVVTSSHADTMQNYARLSIEGNNLRNMQSAARKQIESARTMRTRGIASVASQLSSTLTAVNQAAISSSRSMGNDILRTMGIVTDDINKKEAIHQANARGEISDELVETIDRLRDFGNTQEEATAIHADAVANIRNSFREMEEAANYVQEKTREFGGVVADVIADEAKAGTEAPKKVDTTKIGGFK